MCITVCVCVCVCVCLCVCVCVCVCVSGLSDDGALSLAAHMSRLRAQLAVQANKRYTVCATL